MKRVLLSAWALVLMGTFMLFSCGNGADVSATEAERVFSKSAPFVYKMTPTDRDTTGGTGFVIRAPHSGKLYILTNDHVCSIAKNGLMRAWKNGRGVVVKILEQADYTDLCLVEAPPTATEGLELAPAEPTTYETLYVVGHPLLKPLTLTSGHIVSRETIELIEGEKTVETCKGKSRIWKSVETWFGAMWACVRSLDAWDSSIEIYGGNSGSPLLNKRGQVVGVMFAADNRTNRGLAISLDIVRGFIAFY